MITIVYASRATRRMDDAALAELLCTARTRNQQAGVSGMLIYAYSSFLQQIEGEQAEVDAIFQSILRDPRHRDIRPLSRRPIRTRRYEGWSMGFNSPDAATLADRLPGYRSTLHAPLVNTQLIVDTEIAETLLELCATCGSMSHR